MSEESYMRRAIELAEKARGRTGANPLVGAVIVKGGRIVGSGFHKRAGGAHAEISAIKAAGKLARGATLFVSLEPCAHQGRTPPCAPRLIEAGIARVVVAMGDPDTRVSGKGLRLLRAAGLKVSSGMLAGEAREQNRVYLKNKRSGLPYVTLKWAMSLDGKIATRQGKSKWISSAGSRRLVSRMRRQVQGVLVGSRTARLDDPGLRTPGGTAAAIVIDPKLETTPGRKFVSGGRSIVVTAPGSGTPARRRSLVRAGVELIELAPRRGKLPLRLILEKLLRQGVYALLVEGGGETNARFLEAGLADELAVFIAPKLIGGRNAVTPFSGQGAAELADSLPVRNWRVEKSGPDLLVRGRMKS
jgi:diaminohydroxyphosphoribosylaminopyrimidine deaminase/5-amino-6-(5-phosphoribosylamino)uracil reductase